MQRLRSILANTALTAVALAPACKHAEIPYDVAAVEAPKQAVHAKKLALLPFTDARTAEDSADSAENFEYRGVEFDHTRLDDMRGSPLMRLTELVAKHLAAAHTFSQVILVLTPDQAPEADLVLSGEVRRMRGYVESKAPSAKSGRPPDERLVLAEVLLADIMVRDAKSAGRVYFTMDAGWSMYEPRSAKEKVPDPWDVLGEALAHAVKDMVAELNAADLSGALVVRPEVRLAKEDAATSSSAAGLERVARATPEGWKTTKTSTASRPVGWRSPRQSCSELRLEQRQAKKFHRVLGAYRPAVTMWSCPKDLRLEYDAREEFPAQYLGTLADGSRFFLHTVGESNWRGASEEVSKYLAIAPPAKRHVFRLEPGD